MVISGGCQYLDFKDYNFTSGTPTDQSTSGVDDLYTLIKSNRKKSVLTNVQIGSVKYRDFEMILIESSGDFIGSVMIGTDTLSLSITDDNEITFTIS